MVLNTRRAGIVVGVPHEFTLDFDDDEIVVIELANDARLPVTYKGRVPVRRLLPDAEIEHAEFRP